MAEATERTLNAAAPADTLAAASRTVAADAPRGTAAAALTHALIWSVVPALVVGNLHADTLEATYWGSDRLFGYPEHPPLLSWLIDLVVRAGCPPIFTLLLITQIGMLIAAVYVWRVVRLYASREAAAMAATMFLVSPAATFYGVQVNHNSFLAPFWAAATFYGLAYLETGRWRDAILFAVATGLGLMVKYELAFVVACLFALALGVPRFRAAFRRPATYCALIVVAAIVAPNVIWLAQNDGAALSHAFGAHKMTDAHQIAVSARNALVGLVVLFAVPAILLVVAARGDEPALRRADPPAQTATIGAALAFGPFLAMLIGVGATLQVAKPLWVTPMASSTAIGLALMFSGSAKRGIVRWLAPLSALAMLGFLAYLFVADAIGEPLTSYEPDARRLAAAVESFWTAHSNRPLECIVIAEHSLAASPALWTRSRPHYVDFIKPFWSTPQRLERCRDSGAVAILVQAPDEKAIFDAFPAASQAPRLDFVVPAAFGLRGGSWPTELLFLAPGGR